MNIRDYIKLTGKSKEQVATELGVTRQAVYKWCWGFPTSRRMAKKIHKWSNNVVSLESLLFPEKDVA
jgi:transposase